MTAPVVAERVMKARRTSICPICRRLIRPGDQIAKLGCWQHVEHILDRQRQAADNTAELRQLAKPNHPGGNP